MVAKLSSSASFINTGVVKRVSLWFFKEEPLAGFDSSSISDVLAFCGASVKMQHDGALLFLSGTTVPQQTATTAVEAHKIKFV